MTSLASLPRRLAALAATALLTAGCATAPTNAGPDSGTSGRFLAPLFAHASPDTAYIYASDGLTRAELERDAARSVPQLREMAAALGELVTLWDGAPDPDEMLLASRFTEGLLDAAADLLDPAELAAAGVHFPLRMAVYADGLFPVLRVALSNPAAAKNALARALADVDFVHPSGPGTWRGELLGLGLVVTITDDELIANVALEGEVLSAAARATAPPQGASAAAALAALSRAERARSVGWLSVGDLLGAATAVFGGAPSDGCDADMTRFLAGFPRLLLASEGGAREARAVGRLRLDDPEVTALFASMAARARTLAAPAPTHGFSMALTLDVDGLLNLARVLRDRGQAAGYRCPDVLEVVGLLDAAAKQLTLAKLSMRGLRAVIIRGERMPDLSDPVAALSQMDMLLALIFGGPDDVAAILSSMNETIPDTGEPQRAEDLGPEMTVARRGDVLAFARGQGATASLGDVAKGGTTAATALARYEIYGDADGSTYAAVARSAVDDLLASFPPAPASAHLEDPAQAQTFGQQVLALRARIIAAAGALGGSVARTSLTLTVDGGDLLMKSDTRYAE